MASIITLDDLIRQGGQVPYQKSLKLQVVAHNEEQTYINEKKENRTLVHAAVADASKAVKCTIYDAGKFPRFKTGKSLIVSNVIKKQDSIVVTTATKVFPTGDIQVPDHLKQQGRDILNPPPAPTKTVEEAIASPPRVRVSVKGRVVQEDAIREVFVKKKELKSKTSS